MKNTLLILVFICNISIYGQTFDGNLGSNSLKWTKQQKDFNSPPRVGVDPMSIKLWDNYEGSNAPSNWGSLLEIHGQASHLVSQIYFDNTWDGSRILYRSAFYGQDTWESWRYLLDSKSDVESSGNLKIAGNGNSYISGNFGIGTTNPLAKLEVRNGNIIVRNFENRVNESAIMIAHSISIGDYDAFGTSIRTFTESADANTYALQFFTQQSHQTGQTEKLRIQGNGNVGIGTTNPGSKLTVAGNIHAQEVKVTINAGLVPDYVFANDYKLKSLKEVEDYIKQNSHLPEIPSAREIENSGLMLAEMNLSLLKKMEEMTLYMIEQNKQLIDLKNKQEHSEKIILKLISQK